MKKIEDLRSYRWFHGDPLKELRHKSRMKQMGYANEEFVDKPIIAIINTWSDLSPCHQHFRQRAEDVKRGVFHAGGFPVEIPAMSLTETFMMPTPMLYRNFLSMEVEELLRSQPVDGAILMGGCDKTTPGLLMGAFSMDLPCLFVPAGPMLKGNWAGKTLGSGTDQFKVLQEERAGTIGAAEIEAIENGIARSPGHCMTMGTASTMTSIAETLGLTLPGAASIPAVDANHARMAMESGKRLVRMVFEDLKPSRFVTRKSFENAMVASMALGGSTNAIIHLIAMAGGLNVKVTLDDFEAISKKTPLLANIQPSGAYLMEDFYFAGGLPALLNRLRDLLHLNERCVSGKTLGEQIDGAPVYNDDVIRSVDSPIEAAGSTVILYGTLAPHGCVLKRAAADKRLLQHRGPAVVFENYKDLKARIDNEDLEITPESIIVLKNAGPRGGPGMPEWGQIPLPKKLLKNGVRDMVRISDARMSGTSFGTCILHVCPESHAGGPLGLVETGDIIELDTDKRRLDLLVEPATLEERRQRAAPPDPRYQRGYGALYCNSVTQADQGCDFPFLAHGPATPEPSIFD